MNRIDHTSHAHPATPAGRRACRKTYREQGITEAQVAVRRTEILDEWYGSPLPKPKAIEIHFTLKTGNTCRVIFNQYQNPSLFITAADKGWDRERTVNQAISEAIHGVFQAYGVGSVEDYRVTS